MVQVHGLQVADELKAFVDGEALAGLAIAPDAFWRGFGELIRDLAPRNRALLAERDRLQSATPRLSTRAPTRPS